jgi:hypothetical protein
MQKHVIYHDGDGYSLTMSPHIPDSGTAMYLASDVDTRIEQLERALQSCKTVLQLEQHQRDKFISASNDAIVEAEKALALMER